MPGYPLMTDCFCRPQREHDLHHLSIQKYLAMMLSELPIQAVNTVSLGKIPVADCLRSCLRLTNDAIATALVASRYGENVLYTADSKCALAPKLPMAADCLHALSTRQTTSTR